MTLALNFGYHGGVAMTTMFSALRFSVDFCPGYCHSKIQRVYSHHTLPVSSWIVQYKYLCFYSMMHLFWNIFFLSPSSSLKKAIVIHTLNYFNICFYSDVTIIRLLSSDFSGGQINIQHLISSMVKQLNSNQINCKKKSLPFPNTLSGTILQNMFK